MDHPDVSIVIINYNTFSLTCQCIERVLQYTAYVSVEIILVDNASTEAAPEGFAIKFPSIILVKSSENVGFAKGNNLGIERAKGEYILLLNSDALMVNNVPHILHNFLEHHPRVAAVTARLEYPDGKAQHNCQRFPSILVKTFELLRLQKFVPAKIGGRVLFGSFFDYNSVAYPDWIWGTCFMFNKKLLNLLPSNKLADDFFMYAEDIQWCIEFRKLGYRVAIEPSAKIIHLMGKSGGDKSRLMEQNMQRLMNQYYSPLHQKGIKIIDRWLA